MNFLSMHSKKSKQIAIKRLLILGIILATAWLGIGSLLSKQVEGASFGTSDPSKTVQSITVAMDNNYPPYSYINGSGEHLGITVDQWRLFEKKTGIQVTLLPLQWSEAFNGMKEGNYDVIDTISFNKERTLFLDFTEAYATIDVPIFYAKQITGITDASTLKGFSVAVKKGDLAIKKLAEAGITTIFEYPSAEALIKAASEGQVVTFVMGKPPTMHFLYKYGIQDEFKYSENLYTSQFHRAVKKGDSAVLKAVNDGFAQITEEEYAGIDEKFMGKSEQPTPQNFVNTPMSHAIGVLLIVVILIVLWRKSIKFQVKRETIALGRQLEASEKQRKRAEVFFDAIQDLYFIVNRERVLIDYQASNKRDLYLPPEVFMNKNIMDLYPKEVADAFSNVLDRCFETGEGQTLEYALTMPEGPIYFEARMMLHEDVVVMVVRNIDESHRLNMAIQENLASLKLKNEEMERFVYIVTHDLNSPLIGIKGYASMLMSDFEKGETDRLMADLRKMDDAASKAQRILEAILEYSGIARGDCKKIDFSMQQLANEVINLLEPQARKQQIELMVEPGLPMTYGDPRLILMVLRKLIENSIQHMGDSKTQDALRQVTIRSRQENGRAIFIVQDTGPGIPAINRDRVFGMFEKSTPDDQGLGLGLAIVKRIIERHSGEIWIEEGPAGGTVMCFTLIHE